MTNINLTSSFIMLELFHENINQAVSDANTKFPELRNCGESNKKKNIELLLPNLLQRLMDLSERILLAHYMVAEKHLGEGLVSEKLLEFCKSMKDCEVKNYFRDKYPLLFEGVNIEIEHWLKQSAILLERFEIDYSNIKDELFDGIEPDLISSIEYGLGDRHKGGESVSLITFESGRKLVYKPGSRSLDKNFSDLCIWIDGKINTGFKTAKTIIRKTHTWVEFISDESCNNTDQIHRYYERTGVYLAILYALEASDFHYENIIACGEYPVLIDLESFFNPFMPMEGMEGNQAAEDSVLRVGLLPRIFSSEGNDAIDISGLSDAEGAPGLIETLQFSFDENGSLKANREKGFLMGGKNMPMLHHQKIGLTPEYGEDLKLGFRKTYQFICSNRAEFIQKLNSFKKDEIRILFRNTVAYSHILREGKHPEILKTRMTMDNHLKWLDFAMKEFPLVKYFSTAEKEDLKKHDIPYFYTKVEERHLWHNGEILWENFFDKTGFETVIEKIDTLSAEDMERQCWIIEASIAISENLKETLEEKQNTLENNQYDSAENQKFRMKGKSILNPKEKSSRMDFTGKDFLEASEVLAQTAIKSMMLTESDAHWLVFRPMDLESKNYEIAPAFYDLFSGMPGEILFFAYLGNKTGNTAYTEIAIKAFHHLHQRVEQSFTSIRSLGLFAGWGSLIYMLAHLGKIWNDKICFMLAEQWLNKLDIEELTDQEINSGIVKGSAGFMVACLALYHQTLSKELLDLTEKIAEKLLNKSIQSKTHIAWMGISKLPLTGLSHGASGFALAFARLYEITGKIQYKECVAKILNYENSLFSIKENNWPDLRDYVREHSKKQYAYSTAWSHGAPGIGIVRIELLKMGFKDPYIKDDLDSCIKNCLKKGFGGKHSLCFGDFGNLELLINAAEYFKDEKSKKMYSRLASTLLNDGFQNGFQLTNTKIQSLGLMSGLTGIAYQCLRLSDPENIPSLLSLSE